MKKRFLAGILCMTMILGLTACGTTTDQQIQSKNLMEDLTIPTQGGENLNEYLKVYQASLP